MTDPAAQPHSTIPVGWTWDAESVFPNAAAWEAEVESIVADLTSVTSFQGRLGEGRLVVVQALAARDDLLERLERSSVYALLGYAVETTDAAAVARFGRSQSVHAQVAAAIAFFEPELIALGRERLARWALEEPALAVYEHHLDDLFRREAHLRSSEVEEVLGLAQAIFSGPFAVHSGLVDSDLVFAPAVDENGEPVAVTQGSIDGLLARSDRTLRRSAWESYADGYIGVRNALAANFASAVKQDVFSTRVRRHGSTLEAALSRANVPVSVFDNLIETYRHT